MKGKAAAERKESEEERKRRGGGGETTIKQGEDSPRRLGSSQTIRLHCLRVCKGNSGIRKSHYWCRGFILYPIHQEGGKALFSPRDRYFISLLRFYV